MFGSVHTSMMCFVFYLLMISNYPHMQGGSTPLHVASFRRHTDTIKVLRFHHADVYTENKVSCDVLEGGCMLSW